MKSKSAAIYYCGFLSRVGGAFFHAKNLEKSLTSQGWNVEIITLDNLFFGIRYLPHIIERFANFAFAPFGFLLKERLARFLFKTFHCRRTDLIIFEDIFISWNLPSKAITVLHATWSDNLQAYNIPKGRVEKFKLIECNIIAAIKHPLITVSNEYKDFLVRDHFKGNLTKEIQVVPLGLDQDLFKSKSINPKPNSFIFVGSLEARKNIFFLLDVFKKVSLVMSDSSLTIIGDGPDRAAIESQIQRDGLNAKLLGRLDYEQVVPHLSRHQYYLHTSVKESFSYSLLEAKLCGLITIAYKGLQVPGDFVDIPVETFEVDEWAKKILESNHDSRGFDGSSYSLTAMTNNTLKLVEHVELHL